MDKSKGNKGSILTTFRGMFACLFAYSTFFAHMIHGRDSGHA
jgi:hypothetical protein